MVSFYYFFFFLLDFGHLGFFFCHLVWSLGVINFFLSDILCEKLWGYSETLDSNLPPERI